MGKERVTWSTSAEKHAVEQTPVSERWQTGSVYEMLCDTAAACPNRPALSFQLTSGPTAPAETLTWADLHAQVTRTANLFRKLGVGPTDTVALLMPNCTETVVSLLAGMTAGIVSPINPLMEPEQIAAILRETEAKVVVTLAPLPKVDIAQKAHAAVAQAPGVTAVIEVDLVRYLTPPKSWAARLLRPRIRHEHRARVLRMTQAVRGERAVLDFAEAGGPDRIAAYFHTGGTTGMPKIAQHMQAGMIYNGKIPALDFIGPEDVLICPLPMFHVLGAYPVLMSCVDSGAHLVLPTPAGYRGDGVMDNFWALIERWGVTFMVMVPTAASALLQRPVKHDLSTLKYALCGSAPLPVELFHRFETACGVKILEGYGMTEATCLVSINPPQGQRKIGSVGLPIPYTDVKILDCDGAGIVRRECGPDEIGEICIASLGVFPGYREAVRNEGLFAQPGGYLRTGDLGRIDADGYIWITGRSKDLIIRGGHNIDPRMIEEAMSAHPDVAVVGAIGQPDAVAGELPCVYVELRMGGTATEADLIAHAREHVPERAAVPKYLEIVGELPKTAVGKVFKPELRRRAIVRVLGEALAEAGIEARIEVVEDKARGLVARVSSSGGTGGRDAVSHVVGQFPVQWDVLD